MRLAGNLFWRTPAMKFATVVATAEGDAKSFYDFASKFIVSHPKLSVLLAFAAGGLVGHVL